MNIVLADDRTRTRRALRVLLEQQPDWIVVGEAADGKELLAQAQRTKPDLVLLDSDLPGLYDHKLIPSLRTDSPGTCIVALIKPASYENLHLLLQADGYATKINSPEFLLKVIRASIRNIQGNPRHDKPD